MSDNETTSITPDADGHQPQIVRRSMLGVVAVALATRRAGIALVVATVVMVGGALGFVLLFGGCDMEASRRSECYYNLKQIAVALHNYNAAHGSFPPAYVADETGRPMHSWRALILPFLETLPMAARYRFDEPWDGPHNRLLHDERLFAYQCPSSKGSTSTTNYLAVAGAGTAWPGTDSLQLTDFTDGTAQTILVVEVADSDVIWCEPRDLHVGQMSLAINGDPGQGVSSHHQQSAHVVMADGSAHSISNDLDPKTLRSLLTPRGDECLDENEWAR